MKILYIITGLGLGGAEKVVCELADKMYERGHEVKIAYLTGEVKIKPSSTSIEIIYLGLEGLSSLFSASINYYKIIRKFKPDVVHSHMVHANIFTRLNRIFSPVPRLINSAHSNIEGGKLRMLAYRLTHQLSDITTNVSNAAVKEFERKKAVPTGKMLAIYNGIDLDQFFRSSVSDRILDENTINFISIGRFHEAKDYPNLLQAIFQVKEQIEVPFKFYIVGDGDLRPEIEQLICELDLIDSIVLLGARTDINNLLNQADYLISASKYEGFGLTVAEAMACQVFVIATDSGGTAEIMGDTGILVKPQDSNELSNAIMRAILLSNKEIEDNNTRARKRVEDIFSIEKNIGTWIKLYNG